MAKSLRATPGKKQTYNLYDPGDLKRALKAINERISEVAREWGIDSQIYRDYTAPLKTLSIQDRVRIDSQGRIKFKTGNVPGTNTEDTRTVVTRMLSKQTKGDIIETTRLQLRAGKTVNDPGFRTYEDIKQMAEEFRNYFHELDSLIQEIYDLVGAEETSKVISNDLNESWVLGGRPAWSKATAEDCERAIGKMQKWIDDFKKNNQSTTIFGGKSTL